MERNLWKKKVKRKERMTERKKETGTGCSLCPYIQHSVENGWLFRRLEGCGGTACSESAVRQLTSGSRQTASSPTNTTAIWPLCCCRIAMLVCRASTENSGPYCFQRPQVWYSLMTKRSTILWSGKDVTVVYCVKWIVHVQLSLSPPPFFFELWIIFAIKQR